MQPNKSIKIFIKYFLGPALFLWLSFSIYTQIKNQDQLEQSWVSVKASLQSYKIIYLLLAIVLIVVNWGIEALKWKLSVQKIHVISFFRSFRAVLSGVAFSVSMPNRVGEYLGRIVYMPDGSRLKTISAAMVGSIAQLIITLFSGIIGLLVLKAPLFSAYPELAFWYPFVLYGVIIIFIAVIVFYFSVNTIGVFFTKWFKSARYFYLVEALSNFNRSFLIQLILLSLLRYSVFMLQYIFVFFIFNVDVPAATLAATMSLVFLALAVIPSIALIEIGLRGELSLRLIGLFTINSLGIGLTSVTVWFINLIIPAIIGSLFLLNIKLIKKNDTGN